MTTNPIRDAAMQKLYKGLWSVVVWTVLFILAFIIVVITLVGQANPEPGVDLQATIGWRVFNSAVCGALGAGLALLISVGVSVFRTEWRILRYMNKQQAAEDAELYDDQDDDMQRPDPWDLQP